MKRQITANRFLTVFFAFAAMLMNGPLQAADHAEHAQPTEVTAIQGKGVVQSIDAEANTIMLAHEAIPAIKWPAMTMQFKVLGNAEEQVKAGDAVEFELQGDGSDATISKIQKAK
jgi:Cu/Ag efflux protein CusF